MEHSLVRYCGASVEDDGKLSNVSDIIDELTEFSAQFNPSAMSEHQLFLQGKAEAYQDVIDYLSRVMPINTDSQTK